MLDKKPEGPEMKEPHPLVRAFDAQFGGVMALGRTVSGRLLAVPRAVLDYFPSEALEIPDTPEALEECLGRFSVYHSGDAAKFEAFLKPNEQLHDFVAAVNEKHGLDVSPYDGEHRRVILPNSVAILDIHPQFDNQTNEVTCYFYRGEWPE